MKALSTQVTVSKSNHGRYKWRVRYPEGGRRKNKYFNVKADADKFAVQTRKDIANEGVKVAPITDSERRSVESFREYTASIPEAARPTLQAVIDYYVDHARIRNSSITCQEIADKLVTLKTQEKKKKRTIQDLESRFKPFIESYGDWLACDVTTEIINEFLEDLNTSAGNEKNYRTKIGQLFRYAIQIKATEENPVEDSREVELDGYDVGILTPSEAEAYLCAADEGIVAGIAIGLFAGIRESEIQRLDWSNIDLNSRRIQVKAVGAKKKRRRSVRITDNLHEWLLPHAKRRGSVIGNVPYRWRTGKEQARMACGMTEWPHNAARHSYASYHMEEFGDAGKTALQMGHKDQRVLYDHYFELVTPKDAHTYWSIVPQKAANITDIKAV